MRILRRAVLVTTNFTTTRASIPFSGLFRVRGHRLQRDGRRRGPRRFEPSGPVAVAAAAALSTGFGTGTPPPRPVPPTTPFGSPASSSALAWFGSPSGRPLGARGRRVVAPFGPGFATRAFGGGGGGGGGGAAPHRLRRHQLHRDLFLDPAGLICRRRRCTPSTAATSTSAVYV